MLPSFKLGLVVAGLLLPVLGLVIYQAAQTRPAAKAPLTTVAASTPPAPGSDQQATVFSVDGKAKNTFFSLPQVRLTNPAVAQRINQQLVRYFNSVADDTLAQTARQAVQKAGKIFKKDNDQGFQGYEFEVLYNAHGVLCLSLATTELGAHALVTSTHATFDLRNGTELALEDLLADTTTLQRTWRQQVTESTAESVREAKAQFDGDSEQMAYFRERVRWDERTQAVTLFTGPDFALTAEGLILYSSYDLPLPWNDLSPQSEYSFTWEELRPWWKTTGPWHSIITQQLNKKP